MEKYTVDRIEDGIVTLEKADLTHVDCKESDFSFTVKEGNILIFDGEEFRLDTAEEEAARKRILEKQRNIFKKT